MAFTSKKMIHQGLDMTILKNTKNNTQVHILPSYGALWHGWVLEKGGREVNLIDHYEDYNDLKTNLKDSFQSANLSPFACRIPEGKYTFKGKEYEFVNKFKDGNAIHGLLADQPFEEGTIEEGEKAVSATFKHAYRHEDAGYPFDYNCEVTYSLDQENRVTLRTKIKNVSETEIPIVDGWHPYFKTGSKVDDCLLRFASKQEVEFDNKLIPTGKLLPYSTFTASRPISDIELDNSFVIDETASQPVCTLEDPRQGIKLHLNPSENYPILQLYIPPHRESIAIETLSGAPDAFNNGIGLILLSPGEEKIFSVTYEVELD